MTKRGFLGVLQDGFYEIIHLEESYPVGLVVENICLAEFEYFHSTFMRF